MSAKINPIKLLLICLLGYACTTATSEQKDAATDVPTETEVGTTTADETVPEASEIPDPPAPKLPDYDTILWSDVSFLDSTIALDIRYATTNNFVNEQMYECGRCFLRPDVAEAVLKAHNLLQEGGLGLKMYDCYRPRPIQQKLWDKVPNASYVTPPSKGSMHNRGSAVDLTIVDEQGKELDMGTDFDFFGKRAHSDNEDLPEHILANRILLQETMIEVGFRPIRTEWWHYYFVKGAPKKFELSDMIWDCDH